MNKLSWLFILLFLIADIFVISASAADPVAGEQKAGICFGCHGEKGQNSSGQFPNLAGQQSTYIRNQLNAFKSGDRVNPMMQSIVANLDDSAINDLAAFFSSQKPSKSNGDAELAKSGENKASMCTGCHGSSGAGNGQFPRLAGQHPDYLIGQLTAFKKGTRKSGPMQAITANLIESDFKALAAYFGSL